MIVNETLRIELVESIKVEAVKVISGNGSIEAVKESFRPKFVFDLMAQGCPRQTARRIARNTIETITNKTLDDIQKSYM